MTEPHATPSAWPDSGPPVIREPRKRGVAGLVLAIAVTTAAAALVLSVMAIMRQVPALPVSATTAVAPPTDSSEQAAAKTHACESWKAASRGMVVARQPFLDATQVDDGWSWSDPAIQDRLAQAQAGTLTQAEYLRAQLTEKTPEDVASPIRDYIALSIAIIALDGQHQRADIVNEAAERGNAIRAQLQARCAGS